MDRRIAFKGMEPLDIIEKHVEKELSKLDRILSHEPSPIHLDTVIESLRGGTIHKVETILKSPHYNLVAHYECPDVYEAINTATEKLYHELQRAKEKRIDKQKSGTFHREG